MSDETPDPTRLTRYWQGKLLPDGDLVKYSDVLTLVAEKDRQLAEVRAEREWRPIATAPKMTELLVLADGRVEKGIYADHHWMIAGECLTLHFVTHWMPLPTPPAALKGGDADMTRGEMANAVRRALNKFDEWNDVTGVFLKHSGYYYEAQSVIEDAVHCGVQAALQLQGEPLPSERTPMKGGAAMKAPKPTPRCQCAQLGKDAPCGWCDGPDREPGTTHAT